MFWSKIWFFLIAVVGAAAVVFALVMPRPAERQVLDAEEERLARARWGVEMLLRDNARVWIDLASGFARAPAPAGQPRLKLDEVLDTASRDESISDASHATARDTLQYILAQVSGSQKPEFVVALDKWGRVVAGVGADLFRKGENLGGYYVVEDALRGYLRDDLWYEGDKLYRIAAAPVIDRARGEYVGALVLGDEADLTLAKDLEDRVGAHVAFFVSGDTVAVSVADHAVTKDIQAAFKEKETELDQKDAEGRPVPMPPFEVAAGSAAWQVALKRLPGEVAAREAYFAVFAQKPHAVGFTGTLRGVTKDDLSLSRFPWIWLGIAFLLAVAFGIFLMVHETDRPLRQLVLSSVKLGRGEIERLPEEQHKGKFGSVARSVNIALERLERDARMTPKGRDLGAVLGPPPEASAPPPMPVGGPASFQPRPSGAPFEFPGERRESPPPPPLDLPPPRRTQSMSTPPPVSLGPGPRSPVGLGGLGRGGSAAGPPGRGLPLDDDSDGLEFVSNAVTGAGGHAAELNPFSPPPPGASTGRARRKTGSLALQPTVSDDELMASTADLSAVTGKNAVTPPPRGNMLDQDFGGETVIHAPSEQTLREAGAGVAETGFEKVYNEFMALKDQCGEPTEGLTLEKFSEKLRKNRDQLVSKYNCKAVKFQVYIKDGKAALKATPIKS